jgi:hypothetical protein
MNIWIESCSLEATFQIQNQQTSVLFSFSPRPTIILAYSLVNRICVEQCLRRAGLFLVGSNKTETICLIKGQDQM